MKVLLNSSHIHKNVRAFIYLTLNRRGGVGAFVLARRSHWNLGLWKIYYKIVCNFFYAQGLGYISCLYLIQIAHNLFVIRSSYRSRIFENCLKNSFRNMSHYNMLVFFQTPKNLTFYIFFQPSSFIIIF